MIIAEEAYKLYDDNAFLEFTTMEAVYERIGAISRNGGGTECQISFDSFEQKNEVWKELRKNGYHVARYNGSDDILDVSWYGG